MTGILLLSLAAFAFVASLWCESEVGAALALLFGCLVLLGLILAAYAALGAWLWGLI